MVSRYRLLIGLFLLAFAVASTPAARSAEPVQINVILALTGSGAPLGQAEHTALEILASRVNASGGIKGRPLQFAYADDQTNPQVDVQLANQLLAKNVSVILGPTLLGGCNAVIPLMKNGPVLYCLSPGVHVVPGSFVFTTSIAAYDIIAAEVRYFHDRKFRRLAWVSTTDASGQDGEEGFDLALARPENAGITVVDREHFAIADLSVEAQMSRIKAANVDAIVTWTSGTQMGTLLRGISDAGLEKLPLMISPANLGYRQLKLYAPMLPANAYSCADGIFSADVIADRPVKQAILDLNAAYAATGQRADYLSTLAWGPAQLVVAALRQFGPDATSEQIRGYIAGLRGFAVADGRVDFPGIPQRGLTAKNAYVVRWDAPGDRFAPVSRAGGVPL